MGQTVQEIKQLLQQANKEEFAVLERSLCADTRKGVHLALEVARRRLENEAQEALRIKELYDYEFDLAGDRGNGIIVGLDEVGRGPLAGPLTVGAVILPRQLHLEGLNDSKQLSHIMRETLSREIKRHALAWSVVHVEPEQIDSRGMATCLLWAFRHALSIIETKGLVPDAVLLDGNPLRIDKREINVIKGDSKCASIAAASIIAKVERDGLMQDYAHLYPEYYFENNKGYASSVHIAAIKEFGLTPIHRSSFCSAFVQPTLF